MELKTIPVSEYERQTCGECGWFNPSGFLCGRCRRLGGKEVNIYNEDCSSFYKKSSYKKLELIYRG